MRRSIAFLNGNFDIVEQIQMTMEKVHQRHGLKTTIHGTEILANLGYEQQIACCRIIQEAATNTLKHAQASSMTIQAQSMDKQVLLIIKDDGTGFDTNQKKAGHYGIRNMIDRANQSRGRLTFSSKPKPLGTTIFVEMPMIEKHIPQAGDSSNLS
jgi:signal transduction histidine kinase